MNNLLVASLVLEILESERNAKNRRKNKKKRWLLLLVFIFT